MDVVHAKSVIAGALVDRCTRCDAPAGEPCKKPDGTIVGFKGHLGVHWERLPLDPYAKVGSA